MPISKKFLLCLLITLQLFVVCVWMLFYRNNIFMHQPSPSTHELLRSHTTNNTTISVSRQGQDGLRKCPLIPPGLVGRLQRGNNSRTFEATERKYSLVKDGRYKPGDCTARQKVAILVPFRDRESHLTIFLNHMHGFLIRQQLDYAIYVVEQSKDFNFNRGFLFNVGFKEALKDSDYDCFVLHDVDLLPENDHNIYTCPGDQPKHLSVASEKWQYKLPYTSYFGGVSAMTREQYEAINGFSNEFFGWGGEDDDFYNRVIWTKMIIYRAINDVGRYFSLEHKQAPANPKRHKLIHAGKKRMWKDGLSSVKYELIQKTHKKLYIHIIVKISK